jgi:hypothetical protein
MTTGFRSVRVTAVAMAAMTASAAAARAEGDCTSVDQDTAAWASKVVIKGASIAISCDECATPTPPARAKRVEVRKASTVPDQRTLFVDGKAVDLARLYVQTGKDTWTNVAMMVGCSTFQTSFVHGDYWKVAAGDTGVAECDAYLHLIDTYVACDKIPQQAKDAVRQSTQQMKQGWAMLRDPNVPVEAKRAAADACRQAIDAVKQSASAMGCAL